MSNLVTMSHNISAETAANMKNGNGGRNSPSPKKVRNPLMDIQEEPVAAAPKANKEMEKITREIVKKNERNLEENEREALFDKINQYIESPTLSHYLPESIKSNPPSPKDSLETLRAIHKRIGSSLKAGHKKLFINTVFDSVMYFTEQGMVKALHMEQKQGMASFMSFHKDLILQPELDEIIIEMGDDYLPDAKTRLFLKVLQTAVAFDNRTGLERENEESNISNEQEKEVPITTTTSADGTRQEKETTNEKTNTHQSSKRFPPKVLRKGNRPSS